MKPGSAGCSLYLGLVVILLCVQARITDKDKVDLMTFKEMRERLLHKDEIRQQQEREVNATFYIL